eukprot:2934460-Alexandrium_andersonii.AAC.1
MSASLVGSEMCIRDRRNVALAGALPQERFRIATRSDRPFGTFHIRASPVSYTHLTLPTICSV